MTCILEAHIPWSMVKLHTGGHLGERHESSSPHAQDGAREQQLSWEGLAALSAAGPSHLSFLEKPLMYGEAALNTAAGACLVRQEHVGFLSPGTLPIITDLPYVGFVRLAAEIVRQKEGAGQETGAHPTAIIHPTASLPTHYSVGPGAIISQRVVLGEGCRVGPYSVLGDDVRVGDHSVIEAHVTISHASLGRHVYVKSGARIGQKGFGFIPDPSREEKWLNVPHMGRILIGDYVEIGANTTIDRGSFEDTVIGAYTRIDNLVQIAHNVQIGKGVVMAAQCGIAGSTVIGEWCTMGGKVGLADHLTIAPHVKIGANSGVMKSCSTPQDVIMGYPAMPSRQWWRQIATLAALSRGINPGQDTP